MSIKLTILGSGPSSGVPGIGIGWGKCDPNNPKNRRLRSSILIEKGPTRLLVDTSPDLREQLLLQHVERLDAVIFSHAHADHIGGIDDLRGINRAMHSVIPAFADTDTACQLKERYGYVFEPLDQKANIYYKPCLKLSMFNPGDEINIGQISIQTIDQDHGLSKSVGFRFENIAYTTDVKNFSAESFKTLEGIDTWIVGAFTDKLHKTHANLNEVTEWIKKICPKKAIITHMGPDLDYNEVLEKTPRNIIPAFDGMVVIG